MRSATHDLPCVLAGITSLRNQHPPPYFRPLLANCMLFIKPLLMLETVQRSPDPIPLDSIRQIAHASVNAQKEVAYLASSASSCIANLAINKWLAGSCDIVVQEEPMRRSDGIMIQSPIACQTTFP